GCCHPSSSKGSRKCNPRASTKLGAIHLRLAGKLKNLSPFVVVTQYPDIEIDGFDVPLDHAAPLLTEKFKVRVGACILYEFDTASWQSPLIEIFSKVNV
uniref:hypothetical protein n=1 Tax=Aureimonas altamirensis TaxID=370622 RepID=UPI00255280C3